MDPNQIAAMLHSLGISGRDGERLDARETALLAKQLEHVKSKTYDILYPGFDARKFIPVSTEAPNGAESITYRQWDQFGMAKIVANYGTDFPRVDAVCKEFTTPIKSLGASYGYSVQDLRAAALSGQRLDAARAAAARRSIEAMIDHVAAFGVDGAGLTGFVNHPNVGLTSPAVGTWTAASNPLDIIKDLNKLVQAVIDQTKGVFRPNTILLAPSRFALISQMMMSADNNTTVLRAFLANNPYITSVDQWPHLELANAAGNGPRIICYTRSEEVLQMELPQDFEQFPPQTSGLEFLIYCHARSGGTVIRYPLAMEYMDGC